MSLTPSSSDPVPAPPCIAPAADDVHWFQTEVHAHEAPLKAYLRGAFPQVRDVDDVVQESYLRLWKTRARHQIDVARAFLFQTAKRVAIDVLRRQSRCPIDSVPDLGAVPVPCEARNAAEAAVIQDKLRLFGEALLTLPPRRREAFIRCKLEGQSRREVSAALGIAEKTIDEHVIRANAGIEAYLRARGVDSYYRL